MGPAVNFEGKEKLYSLVFCANTDTGLRRGGNEDFLFASDRLTGHLPNLFLVADGMGGHKAGEVASQVTVSLVVNSIRESKLIEPKKILKEAIDRANAEVFSLSCSEPEKEGMGTTLVSCSVYEDGILFSNIGDSRAYIVSNGEIRQITKDHTVVGEMLRMGSISKRLAASHPKRHMLTRAVGVMEHIEADYFEIPTTGGEQILLATDGLTNMLSDDEICEIVSMETDVKDRVEKLIKTANENGGDDNITVILVDLKEN